MGNRAVIAFEGETTGIYLHWNGGEESVRAFLDAAKEYGVRREDHSYKVARLSQIIGNFFGGTNSVGVDELDHLDCDNGDNGTYIVKGLDIVSRKHCDNPPKLDIDRYRQILAEVLRKNDAAFEPGKDACPSGCRRGCWHDRNTKKF